MGNVCKKKQLVDNSLHKPQATSSSSSKIAPIPQASVFEAKDDEALDNADIRDEPKRKEVGSGAEGRNLMARNPPEVELLPVREPCEPSTTAIDAAARDSLATASMKEDNSNNMSKQTTLQHSMKSGKKDPTADNQSEPNSNQRSDKYLKRYSIEQLEEDNKTITVPKVDVADSDRNSEGAQVDEERHQLEEEAPIRAQTDARSHQPSETQSDELRLFPR